MPGRQPATMKIKERDIQNQIKDYLKWQGWYVVKIHQSLGSHRGIADLYALKGGRHVWIEVKTPTGKQSEDQVRFQADVEAHGGRYLVAWSVEDIINLNNIT
jgi:Holliday junction resolvase